MENEQSSVMRLLLCRPCMATKIYLYITIHYQKFLVRIIIYKNTKVHINIRVGTTTVHWSQVPQLCYKMSATSDKIVHSQTSERQQ